MTDPLDILYQFELVSLSGVTAVDFWSTLKSADKTIDMLVDLLLAELDLKKLDSPPHHIERLRTIESAGGSDDIHLAFLSEAYEHLLHLEKRPHLDEYSGLPAKYFPALKGPADAFHLGERLAERYTAVQRIGNGNFGVVYQVRDQQTGTIYACKAAHQRDGKSLELHLELLSNEAIAMEKLTGKGCPSDYQLLHHNDIPFLIMQFIEGNSLRDLIRLDTMDSKEASRILASVARTIGHAHQHRIIHRDLKPENILLDNGGKVYVMDFGLVLFGDDKQLDKEGERAGTRDYMPPDALLGATHELDGRTDVYAIGVMLYELLTGSVPRQSSSREEALVAAILAASVGPPWPDEIPDALKAITERCIAANPLHRYANAFDLATDLESFQIDQLPSEAKQNQLFAWDAGLLLGKFNHMNGFAEHSLQQVANDEPGQTDLRVTLFLFFGAQEVASDLKKLTHAFAAQEAGFTNLTNVCDSYPQQAAVKLRTAFYGQGRGSSVDEVEDLAGHVGTWVSKCFDPIEEMIESLGVSFLALFEFAVMAAHAESKTIAGIPNLKPLAKKTELPEAVWSEFVEICEDPSKGDPGQEFIRLKRDVRHYLQDGEFPSESDVVQPD